MPCYHPLQAWRSTKVNPSGKRGIVFHRREGFSDMELKLPCGQCIGCRLERSRQWAIRCMHEAQLYPNNCFITLTYSNENLPKDNTLIKKHFQDFMKSLRHRYGNGIRYFHCGEYGEKFKRPHYHACVFNHDFEDKQLWKIHNEHRYYKSQSLEDLWGLGHTMLGDVTFESAAYVARYITKKVTGKKAFEHYNDIDKETGEILAERLPEYTTMSRRPGLGKQWLETYTTDVYPSDFIIANGKKVKPPKYYDSQYELVNPTDLANIKLERKITAEKHFLNNTLDRLIVREEVQEQKHQQLKRSYENDT